MSWDPLSILSWDTALSDGSIEVWVWTCCSLRANRHSEVVQTRGLEILLLQFYCWLHIQCWCGKPAVALQQPEASRMS